MTAVLEQLELFDEVDFETEPMVSIYVSYHTHYRVPRAEYRFPTGQHDRERWDLFTSKPREAKHHTVRLIDHGPTMLSVDACQYGLHTECRNDNHKGCPFNPGRTHGDGRNRITTGTVIEHRDEHGYWRPVEDESAPGRPYLYLLPFHVWQCACDCHHDLLSEAAV